MVTVSAHILALTFQVIYKLMVIAWSLLLVSRFVPYAAAYFWKKANNCGTTAAFWGGLAVWFAVYFICLPMTNWMGGFKRGATDPTVSATVSVSDC